MHRTTSYLLSLTFFLSACGEEPTPAQPPCPVDGTSWRVYIERSAEYTPEWCRRGGAVDQFDLMFANEAATMGEASCEIEPNGDGCIVTCGSFGEWYTQLYSTFSGGDLPDGVFSGFYKQPGVPEGDACIGIGRVRTTKL